MKPLARLYLTRQRLYEKNCETQDQEALEQESGNDCVVTRWSEWSECDSSCGTGRRSRQRNYRNPSAAYGKGCKKNLVESEECHGNEENCNSDSQQPVNESVNLQDSEHSECDLTDWTEFGECSKTCGKGQKSRTREYVTKKNQKRCQKRNPMELEEQIECEGQSCSGDISEERHPHKKVRKHSIKIRRYAQHISLTCNILTSYLDTKEFL